MPEMPWARSNTTEPSSYAPQHTETFPPPEPKAEEVEIVEETVDEAPEEKPVRSTSRKRAATAVTPAVVKRVAEKTVQVQSASDESRKTASKLLGCGNDVVEIVTAIQTPSSKFDAMGTITALRRADSDMYAAVEVFKLTKSQMNKVWSVARSLGAEIGKTVPAKEMDAVTALTEAVRSGLDAGRVDEIGLLLEAN